MCTLTSAIALECKNGKGGISKLWAVEQTAIDSTTETSGALTAISLTSPKVMLAWNFSKDSASYDEDITPSVENGTTIYGQKLTLNFYKYETTKRNEIKLAAVAPLFFVTKDFNGKYMAHGLARGLDMVASTATSGKKLGDFNGFTLNFMGEEPDLPIEITDSTFIAALP